MQYRQVHLPLLLEAQGLSSDFVVRALFWIMYHFLDTHFHDLLPPRDGIFVYSRRSLTTTSKGGSTCIVVLKILGSELQYTIICTSTYY